MSDFEAVFADLRRMMLETAPGMNVSRDEPGSLVLRTPDVDPGTGEPGWFGTVTIKKTYVAYHLMPLYARPDLADRISDALAKRRQGKTCFNFKRADAALFGELRALTEQARRA